MNISRTLFLGIFLVVSACGLTMSNEERLDRAEQAMAEGDFRAAIIDSKDVLRDEPDNVRGRLLLGRASLAVSDGASAEKEFRRALELGTQLGEIAPQFAQSLVLQRKFSQVIDEVPLNSAANERDLFLLRRLYGDTHLGLGRPEKAREAYQSALEIEPGDVESQLGVISSYVAEENYAQARAVLDQVVTAHGENAAVWVFAGQLNSRLADYRSAEANFRRAIELVGELPDSADRLDALVGIANSLLEQGKKDEALPYVDELLEISPRALPTMLLAARIAFVDQDWAAAQQYLQDALRVYPNNGRAQMLLGAVHLQSGSLEQAEMYLSAAVAAEPDNIAARRLLAETQLQQQKGGEASASLRSLVSGGDADARTLQLAARVSMALEDVDEAIQYLQQAINQDSGNAELKFQLAATLVQAGRISDSEVVLNQIDASESEDVAFRKDVMVVLSAMREEKWLVALEAAKGLAIKYGDKANAFNLLGTVQLRNGQATNAASSFESAIELDPANVIALRYLARIDEAKGNYESASTRYGDILGFYPTADWALGALGRIAVRQDDTEAAREFYRRALELAPDNDDYRVSLARIERREGNNAMATKILETSADRSRNHIPSMVELALLKAKSGDKDEAIELAKNLQRVHPTSPVPFALEGEIELMRENLDLAYRGYAQAVSLGPYKSHVLRLHRIQRDLGRSEAERPLLEYLQERPLDSDVRLLLAQYYDSVGDRRRAIAEYELTVHNAPDNAVALNNLAWNYLLEGDPRALEAAEKALDLMPGDAAVLDTAGWIHVQMGSAEKGAELLAQAVAESDGHSEIRYHHAAALVKLGQAEEARGVLEDLLSTGESFASRAKAEKLLAEL
jgi:Tfp pilus assembly protein PilF